MPADPADQRRLHPMRHALHGVAILFVIVSAMSAIAATDAEVTVRHAIEQTTAEVGRTRMIAFHVESPAERDTEVAVRLSNPERLSVLTKARVLAGHSIGYVRVRGLQAGACTLTVGAAPLTIDVIESLDGSTERGRPVIISPSVGAGLWGRVTVGVELREPPTGVLRAVRLRLSDGRELEPVTDTERQFPPLRTLTFDLDTNEMPFGRESLVPIARWPDGRIDAGPPVIVRILKPTPVQLTAGEAEAEYDVVRPERFADNRRNVGRDRRASGGRFFANHSSTPAVCFPVEVPSAGMYQTVVVARGTRGQGVLPTIGVVVDGQQQSTTNGRLLRDDWHRVALGVPFWLDPGTHVITPLFANDFFVAGRADRNLQLDRIEVVRIDEPQAAASQPAGAMMGMSMAAGDRPSGVAVMMPAPMNDPHGALGVPFRIGFERPLEGLSINGRTDIRGRVWWSGAESGPPPVVDLLLNDEVIGTQRSGAPRFVVDAPMFRAGANRVQMIARNASGAEIKTPVQTMWRDDAAAGQSKDRVARRFFRYSIHEPAWSDDMPGRLHTRRYPSERRSAVFSSNGETTLTLPDDLAGTFVIALEGLGEPYQGRASALLTLRSGDTDQEVGRLELQNWWDTRPVGTIDLPAGPKQLVVAFDNDRYDADKGDRNLLFQSVVLAEPLAPEDRTPPTVDILYPGDAHEGHALDAVVVDAWDDAELSSVELLVDGMRTGLSTNVRLKAGHTVLPLLLRDLAPGEHEVSVVAVDTAGNRGVSEPVTIMVTAEVPATPGTYARAIHLLNRLAYGPDPQELAAVLSMGEDAWLQDRLGRTFDDPGDVAALGAVLPHFPRRNEYEVSTRAHAHLMLTPNPVRARFSWWLENHFSTWIRKVGAPRKWDEHVMLAGLGPTSFDRLLFASAESPAMLAYLDQDTSFAGRLNENYAREVMELHTLGVNGGYSQADVTNLAALLTGWTAAAEGDGLGGGQEAIAYTFRFDPSLNESRTIDVLGMRFDKAAPEDRFERTRCALEMLAAHPSTARFVTSKLAMHYACSTPPDELIDDLSVTFMRTNGDMAAVLQELVAHPVFWSEASADRLALPVGYAVRLSRVAGHFQPWQVRDYLGRSGFAMFDRSSPDGYPLADNEYVDSNAMMQRWRLAQQFMWPLANLVPGTWRYSGDALDEADAQRIVDVLSARMCGRLLRPRSNEAAVQLLLTSSGNRNERLLRLAPFIAQLPEANLR